MDYLHSLDKNDTISLTQECLLETSTSAFARIRQIISTLFKINRNKIPSLYEPTKNLCPMESGKVKVLPKHEFVMSQSDQCKLVRSRDKNDHVRKRSK